MEKPKGRNRVLIECKVKSYLSHFKIKLKRRGGSVYGTAKRRIIRNILEENTNPETKPPESKNMGQENLVFIKYPLDEKSH